MLTPMAKASLFDVPPFGSWSTQLRFPVFRSSATIESTQFPGMIPFAVGVVIL